MGNSFSDWQKKRENPTESRKPSGVNQPAIDLTNIINSDEWKRYFNAGRVQLPEAKAMQSDKHAIWGLNAIQGQLAKVREEDKRIANYYELATGKKADQSVIDQFGQYANDPALLQAAIGRAAATTNFDTSTPAGPDTSAADASRLKLIDSIKSSVQETLGRAPTEAELGYFGKQMEAGNLDAYGLQDFLKGTSEYQTKYADTARTKLAGELGAVDTQYLDKIGSQLESKYASMGRKGSSAFGSALINAGKDLATERTGYLANIGYNAALSGQDSLKAAYNNRLSQMYASQQNLPTAQNQSAQRYYSNQDYYRQAAAQERLAALSQPKQGSFLQSLLPGVIQAGASLYGGYLSRPKTVTNYNPGGGGYTPWNG